MDMLLLTLPNTFPLITATINQSLLTSHFPNQWKIAAVCPLYAKRTQLQKKNLRPVSILLVLFKVLDTVVYNQINKYIEQHNGADVSTIRWFDSYLSGRSQYIQITRADGPQLKSSQETVDRGVPQGSILGPLLFIIYTADLCWGIKHCKYHLYADDVQLAIGTNISPYLNNNNSLFRHKI